MRRIHIKSNNFSQNGGFCSKKEQNLRFLEQNSRVLEQEEDYVHSCV